MNNNYFIWRKNKESGDKCEFLVFETLAKKLSKKDYRDISKGYIFIPLTILYLSN